MDAFPCHPQSIQDRIHRSPILFASVTTLLIFAGIVSFFVITTDDASLLFSSFSTSPPFTGNSNPSQKNQNSTDHQIDLPPKETDIPPPPPPPPMLPTETGNGLKNESTSQEHEAISPTLDHVDLTGGERINVDDDDYGLAYAEDKDQGLMELKWRTCRGRADYIPCLDNEKAIKALKSRKRMEHRERHCPKPSLRCLVPLPEGYRRPVPWPESRDKIWYKNAPHPKLVEYKKDQNWVRVSGDYFYFPGGGTQFKHGVIRYIQFLEKILPSIEWGRHTRVILDVGCGVASFGGYLLERNVVTMSMAPKDEHEAQIQFALERGIPAFLSVIGTQRLPFADNVYDMVHCARCRVHWDGDGGKPLLEINRVLRPGGLFVWSATPVYQDNPIDKGIWHVMVELTKSMCWKVLVKKRDSSGIGVVIYQKPTTNFCYENRKSAVPSVCDVQQMHNSSWYTPLEDCIYKVPTSESIPGYTWPQPWPQRLKSRPTWLSSMAIISNDSPEFENDTINWETHISTTYFGRLPINWEGIRNIMDMSAGYGGFAAAIVDKPMWVMNVVPVHCQDTLPIILERGLIGLYHDWCESFNTYPRTYDLLHANDLFAKLSNRCDIIDVVVEMDRILRPDGQILIKDSMPILRKLRRITLSLHWNVSIFDKQYLVGSKSDWRPTDLERIRR